MYLKHNFRRKISMKITKIITFILFSAFLISILSLTSFSKIEEADLDDNLKFYYRISKQVTEDFISYVYGTEESLTTDIAILDECETFLAQAAYFLEKDNVTGYELNFSFNELDISDGSGNIHITAEVKVYDSVETLEIFIRIGTPQKVITVTDIYISGNAKIEKLLYPEADEPMTLKKFVAWAAEHGENEYAALAKKIESYTSYTSDLDVSNVTPSEDDYFITNPETFDISMIFYILASISAVFSFSTFRRKI